MKFPGNWFRQATALMLTTLLTAPLCNAAVVPQQTGASQQTQTSNTQQQNPPATGAPSAQLPAAPQAAQQQEPSNQPMGTAAAPYETPVGVAVSRPAGAAIAPAKQRRTRSFIIKMGLVIGAAVAVGTVVALSKASPSRPGQ